MQQQKPPETPLRPNRSWIWWLILLALLVWNIFLFLPTSRPEVSIPYSTFLGQIRANNVTTVHISGDEITGTFAKPFLWPQTTPVATSQASPQPTTSPAATPAASSD
ncbi:MAG: ATP-dependent metallopeptidase FtsH/Yme1/Tma family protein, partial [Anaerolineae bacterium]